jgi:hypothetical protein
MHARFNSVHALTLANTHRCNASHAAYLISNLYVHWQLLVVLKLRLQIPLLLLPLELLYLALNVAQHRLQAQHSRYCKAGVHA